MSASRLSVTRVVVGLRVRRSTFPLLETACRVDFVAPAAQRKSGLVLLARRPMLGRKVSACHVRWECLSPRLQQHSDAPAAELLAPFLQSNLGLRYLALASAESRHTKYALLDHPVGNGEQTRWHPYAQRPCGLSVDD